MKRCLFALGAVLGLALPVLAADFYTYEQLTVGAAAVRITATTYTPTNGLPTMTACSGRLETAEVRFRMDGTAPTAAIGTPLEPGDVIAFTSAADAAQIQLIRTGSTSGVLNVTCWR